LLAPERTFGLWLKRYSSTQVHFSMGTKEGIYVNGNSERSSSPVAGIIWRSSTLRAALRRFISTVGSRRDHRIPGARIERRTDLGAPAANGSDAAISPTS